MSSGDATLGMHHAHAQTDAQMVIVLCGGARILVLASIDGHVD